jgi:hypothetical protein
MMHRRLSGFLVVSVALVIVLWPLTVAQAANPDDDRAQTHTFGRTLGEWNARWWQWSFSVPASKNPILIPNGPVDCRVGQSGKVWFLSGFFGTGGTNVLARSCTIPEGKALLVPVINSWADNVCNSPPLSVRQLRALAAGFVTPATNLHASVDGHSLNYHRAKSPTFTYTLPSSTDNLILSVFGVTLPGPCWPSLTVTGAVADGFYAIIPPLDEGVHTVKFGGSGGADPVTTLDVTYKIRVQGD